MSPIKTRKIKKDRKSPDSSATLYPEGTIEFGNDSQRWVVKETKSGIKRWVPFHSTVLFGYAPLTAKILEKHINTPITVYEKQAGYVWPKSSREFDVKYSFTASGDAELVKHKQHTLYSNWLKSKTPAVKDGQYVIIKGTLKSNDIDGNNIQVAPLPGELISSNLMNTDAFIKV